MPTDLGGCGYGTVFYTFSKGRKLFTASATILKVRVRLNHLSAAGFRSYQAFAGEKLAKGTDPSVGCLCRKILPDNPATFIPRGLYSSYMAVNLGEKRWLWRQI